MEGGMARISFCLGVLGVSAMAFVGCGDEVTSSSGSGGSGGAGGSTGGAGGTGNTATGGTGNTSTTGGNGGTGNTGGGTGGFANTCEEACAYAVDCGLDACALANISCGNPDAATECAADCVLNASCDEINNVLNDPTGALGSCVLGCDGGTGGGPAADCGNCVLDAGCAPSPCNGQCPSWLQCISTCDMPSCFDACDAMYNSTSQAQADLYSCACTNCLADCETIMDPCN
jgi:hypothetical protein